MRLRSCRSGLPAVLALCLTACLGLVACGGAGPEGTIRSFHRALEDGELEKAISFMDIGELGRSEKDKFKAALSIKTREIREKGGIESLKVTEGETWEEMADLSVEITYGDGSVDKEEVQMIKRDGQWKIQFKK